MSPIPGPQEASEFTLIVPVRVPPSANVEETLYGTQAAEAPSDSPDIITVVAKFFKLIRTLEVASVLRLEQESRQHCPFDWPTQESGCRGARTSHGLPAERVKSFDSIGENELDHCLVRAQVKLAPSGHASIT